MPGILDFVKSNARDAGFGRKQCQGFWAWPEVIPEILVLVGSIVKDAKNSKFGANNTQVPTLSVSLASQPLWGPVPATAPTPSTACPGRQRSSRHTHRLDPLPGDPGAGRGEPGPRGRAAAVRWVLTGALLVPAVEGQWLEWGAWSRCSVTCANGTQQRTRKCSVSAHGWAECRGAHADARECSNPTCPSKALRAGGEAGGRPRVGARLPAWPSRGATEVSPAVTPGVLAAPSAAGEQEDEGDARDDHLSCHCPCPGSRWGPVGARWLQVLPCFGCKKHEEALTCAHEAGDSCGHGGQWAKDGTQGPHPVL